MVVERMGQDPETEIKRTDQPDLTWLDSMLDTAKTLTETITGAAAAKREQERRHAFELERLRLMAPTVERVQAALPWFVIGIPAGLLILSLLRRRR